MIMRRLSPLSAAVLLALGLARATFAVDPDDLAVRLETVMGSDAFTQARVLHFTWAVERDGERIATWDHTWDRWSGDYRLAGVDRESGAPWLALFNVGSREGRVWLDDEEVTGDALPAQLERAYGRFINDTYWLLMPWKWRDPGVNLTHLGTEQVGGAVCDVVELSFADVGLTSKDRYRAYLDRESGLMVRWAYVLQGEDGAPGSGEPTVWDWTEWTEVEPGVWFAFRKVRQGGDGPAAAIVTDGVELFLEPGDEELAGWFRAP
jgi:hypothetical protein